MVLNTSICSINISNKRNNVIFIPGWVSWEVDSEVKVNMQQVSLEPLLGIEPIEERDRREAELGREKSWSNLSKHCSSLHREARIALHSYPALHQWIWASSLQDNQTLNTGCSLQEAALSSPIFGEGSQKQGSATSTPNSWRHNSFSPEKGSLWLTTVSFTQFDRQYVSIFFFSLDSYPNWFFTQGTTFPIIKKKIKIKKDLCHSFTEFSSLFSTVFVFPILPKYIFPLLSWFIFNAEMILLKC